MEVNELSLVKAPQSVGGLEFKCPWTVSWLRATTGFQKDLGSVSMVFGTGTTQYLTEGTEDAVSSTFYW